MTDQCEKCGGPHVVAQISTASGVTEICEDCFRQHAGMPTINELYQRGDGPKMTVTIDLLEALLERKWEIKGRIFNGFRPEGEVIIEYRDPTGVSGPNYWAKRLDEFPPAVSEWIWNNVPMVPAKEQP